MSVAPARPAPAAGDRLRLRIVAASASGTITAALYCSRATLDVYRGPHGIARVAMLPSWPELAGLAVLVTLVTGGALWWLARRRDRRTARSAIGETRTPWIDAAAIDVLLPAFALAVLVVPYLPWIPDAVPVLRTFAGPARFLLWFVVLGQIALAAAAYVRSMLRARSWTVPPSLATALMFAASAAAFGTAASRLAGSAIYPGGDEPHYLIITQSLLRDGDLKIENNHAREDYAEYFGSALEPHYRTRGVDKQIYSIHPVGLPALAVPAYAIGGYRGVVAMLVLIAAWAATLMWKWTGVVTGSPEAATFAWAAVALGAPYLFNTFAVYPEIPAALCVMLSMADTGGAPATVGRWLSRGLAVAALPWLSTKYLPMALAIAAVLVWRARPKTSAVVLILAPIVASTIAWLWFFYWIWGVPLPSAPYGPDPQTRPGTLFAGAPGLLIDQEYGVFVYAPAMILAVAGWIGMWRTGGGARRIAAESLVVFGALLAMVGAFELWWGGSGITGRPLVSGLPLLAPAVGWAFRDTRGSAPSRAFQWLLLFCGLAITGTLLVAQDGLLLAEGRDGASELLRWLSPGWPLTAVAPSFIAEPAWAAFARALPWIAAVVAIVWVSRRLRVTAPGRAALMLTALSMAAFVVLGSALPLLARGRFRPDLPDARGRIDLLDDFDGVARPYAITYSPLRRVPVASVPPLFTMAATPGSRRHPQPLAVLLNARFSLPAGEYEVELAPVAGRALAGDVGLQVGRVGRPLTEWPVAAAEGQTWRHKFTLDIDASFVGLVPSEALAPAVGSLRLTPLTVVDRGARLPVPTVLAASSFGPLTIYFHDENVFTEDTGFWVAGRSTTSATVAGPRAAEPLTLRLHAGPRPSTVFLETPIWRREVPLTPNEAAEIAVPPAARGRLIPLRITTYNGFVPARESPGSQDRRMLGCWVQPVW